MVGQLDCKLRTTVMTKLHHCVKANLFLVTCNDSNVESLKVIIQVYPVNFSDLHCIVDCFTNGQIINPGSLRIRLKRTLIFIEEKVMIRVIKLLGLI